MIKITLEEMHKDKSWITVGPGSEYPKEGEKCFYYCEPLEAYVEVETVMSKEGELKIHSIEVDEEGNIIGREEHLDPPRLSWRGRNPITGIDGIGPILHGMRWKKIQ